MELLRNGWFPEGLSLKRVCELMKVRRSTVYYRCKGESEENRRLMEEIEGIYGRDPTLGYRRMKVILERRVGKKVNHKRPKLSDSFLD